MVQKFSSLLSILLLVALCSVLYYGFLGSSALWDFDEAYFASIARDMYRSQEWTVPVYNGPSYWAEPLAAEFLGQSEMVKSGMIPIAPEYYSLYGDKPILVFWGMLVSFSLFGLNEFAARFPSGFFSIGTVLLTYFLALRLFGRKISFYSGFILATMLVFVLEARGATCDAYFIFGITAAMLVFVYSIPDFRFSPNQGSNQSGKERKPSLSRRLLNSSSERTLTIGQSLLLYGSLCISVLAKGPAGGVFPITVLGLFLVLQNTKDGIQQYSGSRLVHKIIPFIRVVVLSCFAAVLQLQLLLGLAVLLLIAGPWYLLVGLETNWGWSEQFFFVHNLGRAQGTMEGHSGGIWFYPAALLFGTFPWSLLLIPFLIDMFRQLFRTKLSTQRRNAYHFCWIAVLFYIVFFTCVRTKLPHYIAPMFPMLAILYAVYFEKWSRNRDRLAPFWTPTIWVMMISVGIIISTTFLVLCSLFLPNLGTLLPLALGGTLVLGGAIGLRLALSNTNLSKNTANRPQQALVFAVTSYLFLIVVYQWGAASVSQQVESPVISEQCSRTTFLPKNQHERFISFGVLEPSWVLYSGQSIKKFTNEQTDELERLLEQIATEPSLSSFRLITSVYNYDHVLRDRLRNTWTVERTVPYFLKNRDLLVLCPSSLQEADHAEDQLR